MGRQHLPLLLERIVLVKRIKCNSRRIEEVTGVIAANWDAVRFFSCKLEQIFSCTGWVLINTMYSLVWYNESW